MSKATSEEKKEFWKKHLNHRVQKLYRNNGVEAPANLSITEAVRVIKSFDQSLASRPYVTLPRREESSRDREIIRNARWYQSAPLADYLDYQSEAFQRDLNAYGVYVMFEMIGNKEVPLLVEAVPKYVGESTRLGSRLKHHASGGWQSNPADTVTREYLEWADSDAQIAYATGTRPEQFAIRKEAMRRRQLWVRTSHTASKPDAVELEYAMTSRYRSQGYKLWNKRPVTH